MNVCAVRVGGVLTIRKQHVATIRRGGLKHFELCCFRHTLLTILGASGCDSYTLRKISGHSDIKTAMRYCHTKNEYVVNAFRRLSEFRRNEAPTGVTARILYQTPNP